MLVLLHLSQQVLYQSGVARSVAYWSSICCQPAQEHAYSLTLTLSPGKLHHLPSDVGSSYTCSMTHIILWDRAQNLLGQHRISKMEVIFSCSHHDPKKFSWWGLKILMGNYISQWEGIIPQMWYIMFTHVCFSHDRWFDKQVSSYALKCCRVSLSPQ